MLIYIGILIFFSSGPLRAQAPYASEPFNGSLSISGWYTDNFGPLQWPADGLGNQAVRLEACASPFQRTFTRKDLATLLTKIENKRFAPAA